MELHRSGQLPWNSEVEQFLRSSARSGKALTEITPELEELTGHVIRPNALVNLLKRRAKFDPHLKSTYAHFSRQFNQASPLTKIERSLLSELVFSNPYASEADIQALGLTYTVEKIGGLRLFRHFAEQYNLYRHDNLHDRYFKRMRRMLTLELRDHTESPLVAAVRDLFPHSNLVAPYDSPATLLNTYLRVNRPHVRSTDHMVDAGYEERSVKDVAQKVRSISMFPVTGKWDHMQLIEPELEERVTHYVDSTSDPLLQERLRKRYLEGLSHEQIAAQSTPRVSKAAVHIYLTDASKHARAERTAPYLHVEEFITHAERTLLEHLGKPIPRYLQEAVSTTA